MEGLSRASVYLARLDPVKGAEVGKLRPVVILTDQEILDVEPPVVFVCPLSSQSMQQFEALHLELAPRDGLRVTSYTLVEHCRSLSRKRILGERIAQLSSDEVEAVIHRLLRLIGK